MAMEQSDLSESVYQIDLFGGAYRLDTQRRKEVYFSASDVEILQAVEAKKDNPKDAIDVRIRGYAGILL